MDAALLLTGDLMWSSRVAGAATAAGAKLQVLTNPADVVAQASGRPLVILDLEWRGVEPGTLIAALRALSPPPAKIVAFAPHVHSTALQAARDAGCDEVLTRGQFDAQLNAIMRRLVSGEW